MSRRLGFAVLLAAVAVYYLFLLSNGTFRLFAPELLDKTFNSMLVHLLRGEFDVDRDAIDWEGFTRDGRTYAYFGVFPALLRIVAMPFADIAQAHLARLSCLTAVVIFVALQLRILLMVHDSLSIGNRQPLFLAVTVAATVLSGPQIYILGSAWVYHEPILWAAVMGVAFNLVVARAAFGETDLLPRDLALLAVLAGLALLTRPSTGVALYLGTVLLVAWSAWRRHRSDGRERSPTVSALLRDPGVILPLLVLGLMAGAVGAVNFERWGNPFVFADPDQYHFYQIHPHLLDVVRNYGEFDLGRAWIGALYYATGIPYVLKATPPLAAFLNARFTGIEAPPICPLLTNPLTVLLAGIGVYRLWRRPDLAAGSLVILRLTLIGHAAAVLLIFSAMYLALRYRLDLAPFMTLAALPGYRSLSNAAAEAGETRRRQLRAVAVGLCAIGVVGSHYVLLIHKVWSIGVPMQVRLALLPFAPFARAAFEP